MLQDSPGLPHGSPRTPPGSRAGKPWGPQTLGSLHQVAHLVVVVMKITTTTTTTTTTTITIIFIIIIIIITIMIASI